MKSRKKAEEKVNGTLQKRKVGIEKPNLKGKTVKNKPDEKEVVRKLIKEKEQKGIKLIEFEVSQKEKEICGMIFEFNYFILINLSYYDQIPMFNCLV